MKTALVIFLAINVSLCFAYNVTSAQGHLTPLQQLSENLFTQAMSMYDSENVKQAFILYLKAVTVDDKILGKSEKGLIKSAIACLQKELQDTPLNAEDRYLLAMAYESSGDFQSAFHEYKKIIRNFPDTKFSRLSWEQVNRYLFVKTIN
ncbi:MAG: hypothetical protein PHW04_18725 [Candidatus Wallbacteria bacterium]|nr:hypothetical protein [Candidatus Wallbacteria bacterium]